MYFVSTSESSRVKLDHAVEILDCWFLHGSNCSNIVITQLDILQQLSIYCMPFILQAIQKSKKLVHNKSRKMKEFLTIQSILQRCLQAALSRCDIKSKIKVYGKLYINCT